MKVPETYLGKTGKCPNCNQRLKITEKNTRPLKKKSEGADGHKAKPDTPPRKKRIGELLIDAGLINEEQLKDALKHQKDNGGKIGEVLVNLGALDVKTFADFLARQPGVASIDLSNYEISPDLLQLVPKQFAIDHEVFPIDKIGMLLTVAMACPLDSKTIEELEDITKLRVKALLCAVDDIRSVIERYYAQVEAGTPQYKSRAPHETEGDIEETVQSMPAEDIVEPGPEEPVHEGSVPDAGAGHLESSLKLENVAALIRRIETLPALPETVQHAQEAMEDPDVSIHDLVDIVRTDPPLAAKVLSVANSAAYGFPNRVDSLSLAATLLGLHETYTLVLSSGVVNTFGDSWKRDYREFWTQSMLCAHIATDIAKACGRTRLTGVFAAGLLFQIGRIALWEAAPQRYGKLDHDLEGMELISAEESVLGLGYPEAGYVLASNWGLPTAIVEPIRFHYAFSYAQKAPEVTAIICCAAGITHQARNGNGIPKDEFLRDCGEAMEFLGMDFDALAAVASHRRSIETESVTGA